MGFFPKILPRTFFPRKFFPENFSPKIPPQKFFPTILPLNLFPQNSSPKILPQKFFPNKSSPKLIPPKFFPKKSSPKILPPTILPPKFFPKNSSPKSSSLWNCSLSRFESRDWGSFFFAFARVGRTIDIYNVFADTFMPSAPKNKKNAIFMRKNCAFHICDRKRCDVVCDFLTILKREILQFEELNFCALRIFARGFSGRWAPLQGFPPQRANSC